MVQRLTWVKLADSSQAQWIKTFHLYKGFSRKSSNVGDFIKGSVRVIQPIADPYKGFTVRRINKGRVASVVLVRQSYPFHKLNGFSFRTKGPAGLLLKDDRSVLIKHVVGPCLSRLKNKKFLKLFRSVI